MKARRRVKALFPVDHELETSKDFSAEDAKEFAEVAKGIARRATFL
jgi:hypothetical protein